MSMQMLSAFAADIGAEFRGADMRVERICHDSRRVRPGDLYVALRGEVHDGHRFLADAKAAGAVAALVDHWSDCGLPQLRVDDVLLGLQAMAAAWRNKHTMPVIAVTGSNGKTTTKQLLASIFATRGPVLATEGNLNNHIGVPLTLLALRAEHRTAVIEMGANHAGEIALLTRLARPDVGVVTQAGDAHLEGFGSRSGVARAKGELFSGLGDGIAAINADDAYADLWADMAGDTRQIRFGLQAGADVHAEDVQPQLIGDVLGSRFVLETPVGRARVKLPLPGTHNVMNALAAVSCAVAIGLDISEIASGLAGVQAAQGRLSWKTTTEGARLLDDSYNANPTSLQAGMELLAAQPGRRYLVLGAMAELGDDAARLHHEAGVAARALGIDGLYGLGSLVDEAVRGFGGDARVFDEVAELAAALKSQLDSNSIVLVKGSRSARMERVVEALTGEKSGGVH